MRLSEISTVERTPSHSPSLKNKQQSPKGKNAAPHERHSPPTHFGHPNEQRSIRLSMLQRAPAAAISIGQTVADIEERQDGSSDAPGERKETIRRLPSHGLAPRPDRLARQLVGRLRSDAGPTSRTCSWMPGPGPINPACGLCDQDQLRRRPRKSTAR